MMDVKVFSDTGNKESVCSFDESRAAFAAARGSVSIWAKDAVVNSRLQTNKQMFKTSRILALVFNFYAYLCTLKLQR